MAVGSRPLIAGRDAQVQDVLKKDPDGRRAEDRARALPARRHRLRGSRVRGVWRGARGAGARAAAPGPGQQPLARATLPAARHQRVAAPD